MKKLLLFLTSLLLVACVTINIYFPAAAAEKAADQIIKEIQQNNPPAKKSELKSNTLSISEISETILLSIANQLIPIAEAAEADLDIDSPEVRRLQSSMKNRFANLDNFYKQGFVGIKQDGLIGIKDASNIPLKDRNQINQLVAAENKDREDLYQAIANANGHPDWASQIKSTFAARWISNAQSGWWYEVSANQWKQK
ncbi:MAG: hypothetical protein RL637_1058 [Pseudomonadota bacterium]|jgi:uncharacterized protein YdbL (DUF1318 family)